MSVHGAQKSLLLSFIGGPDVHADCVSSVTTRERGDGMDVRVWWGGVEERGETAVDGLVGCYLPPPLDTRFLALSRD